MRQALARVKAAPIVLICFPTSEAVAEIRGKVISNMALARAAAVKQNISPYPMAATPFNVPSAAALTHPRPIKPHHQ